MALRDTVGWKRILNGFLLRFLNTRIQSSAQLRREPSVERGQYVYKFIDSGGDEVTDHFSEDDSTIVLADDVDDCNINKPKGGPKGGRKSQSNGARKRTKSQV